LTEPKGFLVISAANISPAKKAGILGGNNTTTINGRQLTRGGDIIQKADNNDVKNIHELLSYIENEKKVGDNMLVTVLRNGIQQSINVKLDSIPAFIPQLK
jgi:S1-C subfamily serine protease